MTGKYPELLTLPQAIGHATDIVAERGTDFIYQRHIKNEEAKRFTACWYVKDGEPDCIVGKILHRHGMPATELAKWEGVGAAEMGRLHRVASSMKRKELPVEGLVTTEAASFLDVLQVNQDVGTAYGRCLVLAMLGDAVRAFLARS